MNYEIGIFLLFILPFQGFAKEYEVPFGKDAALLHIPRSEIRDPRSSSPGFEHIIAFHQHIISPADGPRSHYIPSSSTYMLQAVRKYGFFSGFCLGCDRLMRENNSEWHYLLYKTKDGDVLKLDLVP